MQANRYDQLDIMTKCFEIWNYNARHAPTKYQPILNLQGRGDVRAESALQISLFVRFNPYAKISQIRCTRNFASCHGPGYRAKKDIHLNLFRAGLVKAILELNQSPWSGHSALMGKVKRKWQNSEYVLSFFGQSGYKYPQ